MTQRRTVTGLATLTLLSLLLAPGCKKKAGDACEGESIQCSDKQHALLCVNGHFAATSCLGPKGCATNQCDQSKVEPNSACTEGAACSADGKSMLECKDRKFVVTSNCSGPEGCHPFVQGRLECDQSKGKLGDLCSGGGVTCSLDGKDMLKCEGNKFVLDSSCRGPKGCSRSGIMVNCDRSMALAGDACEGSNASCVAGGKGLLECKGGKYQQTSFCRGPKGCAAQGIRIECDDSIANEGDPCTGSRGACNADGTAVLECRNDKMAVAKKCHCKIEGMHVHCG